MKNTFQFETERLRLRPMDARDRSAFIAMNLDPEVMRYFTEPLTPERSQQHIARYEAQLARDGFTFLTAERRDDEQYLGIIGMQVMSITVPGVRQPAVEIGWRLTRAAQGYGYATEGARALVDYAFHTLRLPQIVAITATGNAASRHVMEKLGMAYRPEFTFQHPMVPAGHEHREHVVYSLESSGGNA